MSPKPLFCIGFRSKLRIAFEAAGYALCTDRIIRPGLIEVYPHPALIELASAPRRLQYKIQKVRKYWPDLTVRQRHERLLEMWSEIVALLDARISGIDVCLQIPTLGASNAILKSFEDMLDAVICAWVGICALEGRATAYGDNQSAIWIPDPGQA